ncbi:MAG TPA: SURF1 family protein [Burkholderiales bacterium]|nr:SURF1 family protein [Burkholderiales bacterium]
MEEGEFKAGTRFLARNSMAFTFQGRAFRPKWWGFALAAAGCAAFIALGNWQARRAEEKRALAARLDAALRAPARELPPRPVAASDYAQQRVAALGTFLSKYTVLLDNKIHDGRLGYEVVTPLRLGQSSLHVLVDRGWVAAGARRDELPELRTPSGELRIEGFAVQRLPQAFEPQHRPPRGRVWQNLRLDDFAAATGLALQPVVIEQLSQVDDGLLRDRERPDTGAERNASYALQWYSFAALSVILFLVQSFRREQRTEP